MYKTNCPKCGASLFVTGLTASTRIPLYSDGFSPIDASFFDTSDEKVQCNAAVPHVFDLGDVMVEDEGEVEADEESEE